ncbi:MAG TPA: hypothetical protein VMS92_17170 [Mycobacterium sp.]|nr:hypothetical protein [Mycobacterium sp.]
MYGLFGSPVVRPVTAKAVDTTLLVPFGGAGSAAADHSGTTWAATFVVDVTGGCDAAVGWGAVPSSEITCCGVVDAADGLVVTAESTSVTRTRVSDVTLVCSDRFFGRAAGVVSWSASGTVAFAVVSLPSVSLSDVVSCVDGVDVGPPSELSAADAASALGALRFLGSDGFESSDVELDEVSPEEVELPSEGVANATPGWDAIAIPTPNATAKPPTRPTYLAFPIAFPFRRRCRGTPGQRKKLEMTTDSVISYACRPPLGKSSPSCRKCGRVLAYSFSGNFQETPPTGCSRRN